MAALRNDNDPPGVILKNGWRYHHVGVPTKEAGPGEQYLPEYKMYVRGFGTSPYGVEWMRFEPDSPLHEIIRTVPHVAFEVDDIEKEVQGKVLLCPIASPSAGVRSAMFVHEGAPVELLQFDRRLPDAPGLLPKGIRLVDAAMKYVPSYNAAVRSVAEERKYLMATEGFSLERSESYVESIVENELPQFYAVKDNTVIGWCDIVPRTPKGMRSVGILGMGIIKKYRGQGIGKALLHRTIRQAAEIGLKKVELEVFASNEVAIRLYQKFGFVFEGRRMRARTLDRKDDDILLMRLFL